MLLDGDRRVDRREQGPRDPRRAVRRRPDGGGARSWNDANVLALSLRATSEAELDEILDAWFAGAPSADDDDRANVEHLDEIERGEQWYHTIALPAASHPGLVRLRPGGRVVPCPNLEGKRCLDVGT